MTTKHVCDHTGVEIPAKDYHGPTRFAFEGTDYEIDLSTGSSRAFAAAQVAHRKAHEAMGVFATKGRTVAHPPATEVSAAPVKPKRVRKPAAKKAPVTVTKRVALNTGTGNPPGATVKSVAAMAFTSPPEDLKLPASDRHAPSETLKIRKWAAANGHPEYGPGKRGRIPAKITAAYEASKEAK